MAPHNLPDKMFMAMFEEALVTATATIVANRDRTVFKFDTTGGAITATLAAPVKAGMFCAAIFDTDGGTDVTLTVTNGYNADGDTSITMADAGDFVIFYSIDIAGTKYWRILKEHGTNAFFGNLILGDNQEVQFGDAAGGDRAMSWNATYLRCGNGGMWDDAPSLADPMYPQIAYELFDDFLHFDPTASTGDWPETVVGTGTQALLTDVAGGILRLSCQATTDNACEQCQYVSDPFKLAATKTLWYETRVRITGDVQSEHCIGLAALGEDLTAVADVKPQDGVAFTTQDTSLALALTASKNGTNTGESAGVHTLVTATWVTLGMLIDGLTSCTPYVDGVAGTPITATFCDDESLAPIFLVRNGDGTTTQILDIDYIKVVQLR